MDIRNPRPEKEREREGVAGVLRKLVPEEARAVDIAELFRILRRRQWIIVGTVVLFTGLAGLISFQLTPQYTAVAKIMIDARKERVVDIQAVLSGLNPDATMMESEIEVLTSRSLAERVVRQLHLDDDPDFNPALSITKKKSWLQGLSPFDWLPKEWREVLHPSPPTPQLTAADQKHEALSHVVDQFLARLRVTAIGRSLVMSIAYVLPDPAKAARIANTLAEQYLVSQLEAKFDATKRANDWLAQRLDGLRQQVEVSENAVVAYQAKHNLAVTAQTDVTTQQLTELSTQLTLSRAETAAAEARLGQVEGLVRRGGAESAAEVLNSPLIQKLREEESALQRKLSELATRYGDRHPRIINARAEIAQLHNSIENEVAKIVQNLRNQVQVARARQEALSNDVQHLKEQANEVKGAEVELGQLKREAQANRTLYDTFLARFKETKQEQGIDQPDARIISTADIPAALTYPKKSLIVALAAAASLWLGIFLAFIVERLDSGFRGAEQIRTAAGLSTLALIPYQGRLGRRKRPEAFVVAKPASQLAESIRTLLAGVLLSDIDTVPRTVLVTSALPGEGKTAISVLLARVAALGGKRTLLIDCDVRRPSIQRVLYPKPQAGAERDQPPIGLSDVLTEQVSFNEAIFADKETGLHVLFAGHGVPNPENLVHSKHLAGLLEMVTERYDLVIIDSSPVMAVADPLILAALTDRTIFVIQWEKTPRKVALSALRQLANANAQLAGVVLSQVNVRRHARYGFGDYGYYYGRYRGYYND
jgi:succinoglycan biosynthesis transport protein ExoP